MIDTIETTVARGLYKGVPMSDRNPVAVRHHAGGLVRNADVGSEVRDGWPTLNNLMRCHVDVSTRSRQHAQPPFVGTL